MWDSIITFLPFLQISWLYPENTTMLPKKIYFSYHDMFKILLIVPQNS